MVALIFRMVGITALLLFFLLLPFLPGGYDHLAITLSTMVRIFGFAGLLLVPVGVIWLLFELRQRHSGKDATRSRRVFVIVAIVALGLVTLIVTVGAFMGDNLVFGLLFLACCCVGLIIAFRQWPKGGNAGDFSFSFVPLYLVIIPLLIGIARVVLIGPAVEFSRHHAIGKSVPLIRDIEGYYERYGHYPVSLQALHEDYHPSVIGIDQYYYEPNGKAYNLYFKQFSDDLAVAEIVMYNKLGEHAFAAHALDILQYTGAELAMTRGDRERYSLPEAHWIYIKFD